MGKLRGTKKRTQIMERMKLIHKRLKIRQERMKTKYKKCEPH